MDKWNSAHFVGLRLVPESVVEEFHIKSTPDEIYAEMVIIISSTYLYMRGYEANFADECGRVVFWEFRRRLRRDSNYDFAVETMRNFAKIGLSAAMMGETGDVVKFVTKLLAV
jgi:hypothetical protein